MKSTLSNLVTRFFCSYLPNERGLSENTLASYSDCFRLLINYACDQLKRQPEQLDMADFTREFILGFLDYLERKRKNKVSTRNQRLAVIKTFFHFAARTAPEVSQLNSSIQTIARKKNEHCPPETVSESEIEAIIGSPDSTSLLDVRDKAILQVAYNSGARVQEIADLQVTDARLNAPLTVTLTGKGSKTRVVPIWPETASLISNYLELREQHGIHSEHLFLSNTAEPLTRFGIAKRFRKHGENAADRCPSLQNRRIHPHIFRHTTALRLADAGNDITAVQEWLGHADMRTSSQYFEISIERKRQALEKFPPPDAGPTDQKPAWKKSEMMTLLTRLSNKARYVANTSPGNTPVEAPPASSAT